MFLWQYDKITIGGINGKEYIKASEYAKKMSLHIRTVYRYYHNGKIKGYQDKETGTILFLIL